MLTSGVRDRLAVLRGMGGAGSTDNGACKPGSDSDLDGVLRELQLALAEELSLSIGMLRAEEDKAAGEVSQVFP